VVGVEGGRMTDVVMSDCVGLWRRTLLIEADGSRDAGGNIAWLQGITAYVDSRGFAGRLTQRDDVFEWSRQIDVEPPGPHPDAGRMHWEDGTLIEVGVHADYVEHWVRDDAQASASWALFLRSDDLGDAILLRAGDMYGWADRSGVRVDSVAAPEFSMLKPVGHTNELEANGVRWSVVEYEGDVDL
jgi:hypothetical protein